MNPEAEAEAEYELGLRTTVSSLPGGDSTAAVLCRMVNTAT